MNAAARKTFPYEKDIEKTFQAEVTEYFPNKWPLSNGGQLVSYGYLSNRFGYADAESQKGPWCKITVDPRTNKVVLTSLKFDEHPWVQGVHALTPSEIAIVDTDKQVIALLESLSQGKAATKDKLSLIRAYYQLWRRNNAALASRIAGDQQAFFERLDHESDSGSPATKP